MRNSVFCTAVTGMVTVPVLTAPCPPTAELPLADQLTGVLRKLPLLL
jgi:hypothetical protein